MEAVLSKPKKVYDLIQQRNDAMHNIALQKMPTKVRPGYENVQPLGWGVGFRYYRADTSHRVQGT